MITIDLLQAQYDLVNEGVLFINPLQMVTKMNKTAEILFNTTSEVSVGLQISEFFGVKNNHFLNAVNLLTAKVSEGEKDDEGTIGKAAATMEPQHLSQQLLGTYLIQNLGKEQKGDEKYSAKIPLNFYIHRLTTEHIKTYGFCIILQPIIIK